MSDNYIWFYQYKLYEYDTIYFRVSQDFIRPPLHNISRTIRSEIDDLAVCVRYET